MLLLTIGPAYKVFPLPEQLVYFIFTFVYINSTWALDFMSVVLSLRFPQVPYPVPSALIILAHNTLFLLFITNFQIYIYF